MHPPAPPEQVSPAHWRQHPTDLSLFAKKRSGKGFFSSVLLPLGHLEMPFPIFPLQDQTLGSRMLQNKACEKVPGRDLLAAEVSGVMEDEDGGRRGIQEDVGSQGRESEEGGVKCQGKIWTNAEHRGFQCLQLM